MRQWLKGRKERQHWWIEGGSKQPLWKEAELEGAIVYVRDCQ